MEKLESIIIQVNATQPKGSSGLSVEDEMGVVVVRLDLPVLRPELGWQDVNNSGIVFN